MKTLNFETITNFFKKDENNNRSLNKFKLYVPIFISIFMTGYFTVFGKWSDGKFGGNIYSPSESWINPILYTLWGLFIGFGILWFFTNEISKRKITKKNSRSLVIFYGGILAWTTFFYTLQILLIVVFANELYGNVLNGTFQEGIFYTWLSGIFFISFLVIFYNLNPNWKKISFFNYKYATNTIAGIFLGSFTIYFLSVLGVGTFGVDANKVLNQIALDYSLNPNESILVPIFDEIRNSGITIPGLGWDLTEAEMHWANNGFFAETIWIAIRNLTGTNLTRAELTQIDGSYPELYRALEIAILDVAGVSHQDIPNMALSANGVFTSKGHMWGVNNDWQGYIVFSTFWLVNLQVIGAYGLTIMKGPIMLTHSSENYDHLSDYKVYDTLTRIAITTFVLYFFHEYFIGQVTNHNWNPGLKGNIFELVKNDYHGTIYYHIMFWSLLVLYPILLSLEIVASKFKFTLKRPILKIDFLKKHDNTK